MGVNLILRQNETLTDIALGCVLLYFHVSAVNSGR